MVDTRPGRPWGRCHFRTESRFPVFVSRHLWIFEESYGKKQIRLQLGMDKSKARFTELIKDAARLLFESRTIAALTQRQAQGGFWDVHAALTRTATEILSLPHEADEAVPTSLMGDGKYFVDQQSNFGAMFTRLAPAAKLSKTPAYSETGPAINGAHDPFRTGWDNTRC